LLRTQEKYLVGGGLEHEWITVFSTIYGMSSFPLTFIFFRGLKSPTRINQSHVFLFEDFHGKAPFIDG
jgi:hypothetical protein